MALLDIRNLTVEFETTAGLFRAVDGVSLSCDKGEILAIVGESGSGKSVAMLAVMGLLPWTAKITADRMEFDGRDLQTLECGAHWSFDQATLINQARSLDRPTALHNNCSGKHAGFVCACCHAGDDPAGYSGYDHPLQQQIRATMESLTGATLGPDNCGTDGCSIPTYAVSLKGLAFGFAKMATGRGLESIRARAARRLIDACMAEPFYVAGTRRFCTRLMQVAPGRIFAKTGAEGVFCAVLPEKGLSFAVKCEDGTTRAAETMIAALLARHFDRDSAEQQALKAMANHTMKNWNGIEVGTVRVTDAMFG